MPKLIKCKECKMFERGKWHESLGGGDQLGGNCPLLLKTLQMNNSDMVWKEKIYVQESFGCIFGRK